MQTLEKTNGSALKQDCNDDGLSSVPNEVRKPRGKIRCFIVRHA